MFRDFIYWLKRYSKSKFFKLVLFFAIFCIISLCKKCDVHASWYGLSISYPNSSITYNFAKLNYNSYSDNLNTIDTISYNVDFNNVSNMSSIDSNNFLLLKNIVVDYKFSNDVTIDTTNYKFLSFNFKEFYTYVNSNSFKYGFLKSPTLTQKEQFFSNAYNMRPYYAEYYDNVNNVWYPINELVMFYNVYSYNDIEYTVILPNGTNLNEIRIYLGTERNYFGTLTDLTNNILTDTNIPTTPWFYSYNYSYTGTPINSNNIPSDYNFLAFIPNVPGASLSNFINKPNTSTYSGLQSIASHGSTRPNQNPGGYSGTSYYFTGSLDDIINNATSNDNQDNANIEQENQMAQIVAGVTDSNVNELDGKYNSALNSFTSGVHATNFTSLFNAMFLYPLQKLYDIKDVDLWGNNGASDYVNLGLCTGTNNITGDWNSRFQIRFAVPSTESDTWFFELPCPHYDIYPNIKHGNFSMMGNRSGMLYNGHITFEFIWRTIMRGLLVYWLYVTCLQVYKYVLDPNDTSVEVLEL